MFDIGWLELLCCFILALFAFKKEDIQALFYRIGQVKNYFRKMTHSLENEFSQELNLDEIKQKLRNESILEYKSKLSREEKDLPKEHD